MLAQISFSWESHKEMQKLSRGALDELCALTGLSYKEEVDEKTGEPKLDIHYYNDCVCRIQDLMKFGIEFRVKRLFNEPSSTELIEKMTQLGKRLDASNQIHLNQKCNVHVSNMGLMRIRTVRVENDLCTVALQDLLNDGWRILAVCVQPDQRRPDYVLGKTK